MKSNQDLILQKQKKLQDQLEQNEQAKRSFEEIKAQLKKVEQEKQEIEKREKERISQLEKEKLARETKTAKILLEREQAIKQREKEVAALKKIEAKSKAE